MFSNILVPLDGSTLSEAALQPAAVLAKKFNSTVMLLHIIEADAPAEIHKERHLTQTAEAETYLKDTAKRAFPEDLKVSTHVHSAAVSDVARSIVEHATAEFHPDLIVISTHGKGGMRDVLFGSIAQQVVSKGKTPLLVVRPDTPPFQLNRILLPLDPDSIHDESFPAAERLAEAFQAALILFSVVPTYATVTGNDVAARNLMPASTSEMLHLREETSLEHLQEHVEALHARRIQATAEVSRGEPAAAIIAAADKFSADLVVLSTHRKAGMEVFWSLSVAPQVVQRTKRPLMLIPL
jgi:nucleotide-binding universal stress UspA family protein